MLMCLCCCAPPALGLAGVCWFRSGRTVFVLVAHPCEKGVYSLTPQGTGVPWGIPCVSQGSEKLWVDLAYFCYSAIAVVPSNGEGGFQIAAL